MTDSVAVFPPGFRVTDAAGAVVPGAKIKFFAAGTSTPRTVYSNSGLSTSLSDTVTCDAYGAPVSGGGSNVLIYTGTTAYKVAFYTSADVLIPGMSFDNVRGALDTSTFGLAATITYPVVAVSTSATTSNTSKIENTNPTAGQLIRTLPTSAATGNGGFLWARHDGTANATLYTSQGTDVIHMRGDLAAQTTLPLFEKGDGALLHSDGVDWQALISPPIHRGKLWRILAIQTAPPSSPVAGDSYIITGSPTGAWSSFAANDIVTSNGNAGWIRSRPATDIGWVAYVVSSGLYYRFVGSGWRSEVAGDATTGTFTAATAAEQAAGTSLTAAVTPARQQSHLSACKAWINLDTNSPGTIRDSYNVSSITRNTTGDITANFTVPFSNANYALSGWARDPTTGNPYVTGITSTPPTTSSCRVRVCNGANGSADATHMTVLFFGRQ